MSLRHHGENDGQSKRVGCIGFLVTRAVFNSGKVHIVMTNDPIIDLNYVVYMFPSHSTYGKFHGTIKAENGKFVINENPIAIFQEQDPTKIKWGDSGIDYVVESTGVFTAMGKARTHLRGVGGAKRVIISAPSADGPKFVIDINHEKYPNSLKFVSNASCTTRCSAPLPRILHNNYYLLTNYAFDIFVYCLFPLRFCISDNRWLHPDPPSGPVAQPKSGLSTYEDHFPHSYDCIPNQ
ncbi:glyceraldehyde-3-phosphate dehydrogenase-like [Hylobates moloch]|uniref:glyceraldehyde-3-phosphate dehydrogenase-like n=1 Tax=Hylobates moloch TaxID=81572 RepID=UPI002676EC8E|nr:glyceraldehyde-3-phosphate dehydrogenase-like [Hylobates moloch]